MKLHRLIFTLALIIGFGFSFIHHSVGQGRLASVYQTLEMHEFQLQDLMDNAKKIVQKNPNRLIKSTIPLMEDRLAGIGSMKNYMFTLLFQGDDIPHSKHIFKLERIIEFGDRYEEIRRLNLAVANSPPSKKFSVLTIGTPYEIMDNSARNHLKKVYQSLRKARKKEFRLKDLNVVMIQRDSLNEIREVIDQLETLIYSYTDDEDLQYRESLEFYSEFLTYMDPPKQNEDVDVEFVRLSREIEDFESNQDDRLSGKMGNSTSFESGSSELLPAGRSSIQNWVKNTLSPKIQERLNSNTNAKVKVVIEITGYTDPQSFISGQSSSQRMAQNQELSRKRAEVIRQVCLEEMRNEVGNLSKVITQVTAVGKGEEMPPWVSPADNRINNPDRRIVVYEGLVMYDF